MIVLALIILIKWRGKGDKNPREASDAHYTCSPPPDGGPSSL